jgi:outer membrane protein
MDYMFRPKQTVFVDVSATSLPEEIKSSPIVGRSSVSRVSVGYLYRF